jgi:hypothetical protein
LIFGLEMHFFRNLFGDKMMDKNKFYKIGFLVDGIYVIFATVLFFVLSLLGDGIFTLMGMIAPASLFFMHAMLGIIFSYGFAYLIKSRDINKNQGINIPAIIGRASFVACCIAYFVLGEANFMVLLLGSVDVLFEIFHVEFMINYKET